MFCRGHVPPSWNISTTRNRRTARGASTSTIANRFLFTSNRSATITYSSSRQPTRVNRGRITWQRIRRKPWRDGSKNCSRFCLCKTKVCCRLIFALLRAREQIFRHGYCPLAAVTRCQYLCLRVTRRDFSAPCRKCRILSILLHDREINSRPKNISLSTSAAVEARRPLRPGE